jgi:hypothetical protein
MSGGSWDYAYFKVEEIAERLERSNQPLRRNLGAHLRKVALALRDIEWVDSGDLGEGKEQAAILEVLGGRP